MRHGHIIIPLILAAAMAFSSCNKTPKPIAKHIIFIGFDGMTSAEFDKADVPFLREMMENGSYTLKKRSCLPSSSAINWATMFMGSNPELHGYIRWDSRAPHFPARVIEKNNIFPTIFQIVRNNYPDAEIGCIYDWDGIKYVTDTLSMNYFEKSSGDLSADPGLLVPMAAKYIKEKKPDLFAVVFDNPDHVGHGEGWLSEQYSAMLPKLDNCLKGIVDATKEAGIYQDCIFIVTSDHGGINKGHGGTSMNEMETPFVVCGPGIKKGYCFDDISMMQFDVAATMARMFQIEQPQVWTGRPMPIFK